MKERLKRSHRQKNALDPVDWTLEYKGFEPADEGLRESLCTLSNGYLGTRGAANESVASRISYPGTYVAGVFNKLATNVAGKKIYNEDLVNCPNWLPITFRLSGGEWASLENSEILACKKRLDFYHGILERDILFSDNKGRKIRVRSERFVDMVDPHIGAIKYTIEPQDYEGPLYVRSTLDGTVENSGVPRYRALRSMHFKPRKEGFSRDGRSYLSVITSQSKIVIAEASKIDLFKNGKRFVPKKISQVKRKKLVSHDIRIDAKKGDSYRIDKTIALYTSRDKGVSDPLKFALSKVRKTQGYSSLKRRHEKAWAKIWEKCGFKVASEKDVQKIINLHTFHLLQTATRHNRNIDAALGARGLHGESYRGHIFWDEIFVMSLYDYQMPEVSKALLKYRYKRLGEAREYARENGYRGAMFPWQSGATGEEETQVLHLNPMSGKWGPDYSRNQRHISFAIAHNVWRFWERTDDKVFMDRYGAELFLSIASFCSSLAEFSEKDSKYHTHGLMGPDEFHEKEPLSDKAGYTDNAYSNVFIVWILMKANEFLQGLPKTKKLALMRKCGIKRSDPARWEDITRKMNLIIRDDGVISQFEGYFALKELNWEKYKRKYGDIHRMDRILKAEGKTPNAYKVAKQADVLMMFYVFSVREIEIIFKTMGYAFSRKMLDANYDYYIKRTSHGSTLSKVVHCSLAQIMGRKREAWKWYWDVLGADINDVQGGTTPEGIHTGVMGGSLDILLRGFVGIDSGDGMLRIDPDPPAKIEKMEFELLYKKHRLFFSVSKIEVKVRLLSNKDNGKTFSISVYGKPKRIKPGAEYRFPLAKGKRRT